MNRFRSGALALFIVVFWLGTGVLAPLPPATQADDESIARAPSNFYHSIEVDSFFVVTRSVSLYHYFATSRLWMPTMLPQGVEDCRPVRINGPPIILS